MNSLVVLMALAVAALTNSEVSFSQTVPAEGTTTAVTQVAVIHEPPKGDLVAARFLNTCAGCHSVSGAKLTGPDLTPVAAWPEAQLKEAIKRMEVKVGPLADADIESLAQFLQSLDLHQRLDAESVRIQSQFAAKLDVGSPSRGRALMEGREAFVNGGLSCVACHQVGEMGGQLGPNLNGTYAKMGAMPLLSSLDKVGFKIMAAHYQRHPITRQEAVHMVAYMKDLSPAMVTRTTSGPPIRVGVGLAIAGLFCLVAYGRRGRAGRSRKLEYRKH